MADIESLEARRAQERVRTVFELIGAKQFAKLQDSMVGVAPGEPFARPAGNEELYTTHTLMEVGMLEHVRAGGSGRPLPTLGGMVRFTSSQFHEAFRDFKIPEEHLTNAFR